MHNGSNPWRQVALNLTTAAFDRPLHLDCFRPLRDIGDLYPATQDQTKI